MGFDKSWLLVFIEFFIIDKVYRFNFKMVVVLYDLDWVVWEWGIESYDFRLV